ncbi:hypothetical protein BDY17DRAFT_248487 [Neohortaea acidophila]|uniref:Tryptophan--tRNA ligase, mitochondrial n=1 Tax=Neohortaea acidophila TaxID=245834 RepID=A0A6A6PYC8_9PEZI|nr:uncharacterized protein BDY17DRAFT_248487 [Neohortaea acidophila]KAF2484776.1 hypothetical protein BDY17DRAFT_248487 [Neohortaea acidophila]
MQSRSPIWRSASNAFRSVTQPRPRSGIQDATAPFRRRLSSHAKPRPQVIFSGIQPTGIPHLGNYLGALQRWVQLQNDASPETTLIYSLVDLHAITVRQDPRQLRQWKKESLAMLLAIGLDPNRSIIFHQSDVPAHAELMWILSCQASTGYLGRMTQWKDKTANERENSEKLKLGLFSYPVLQAADVLLHQTTHVPVGHDQAQHLEFARELASGFNHVYREDIFTYPETMISPAKRVMSLTDPSVKMSKSHSNPKSRILLTDDKQTIEQKIKQAMTDSLGPVTYDPQSRAGVSNLLDIVLHCDAGQTYQTVDDIVSIGNRLSLKAFKEWVAERIEQTVRPICERYADIVGEQKQLDRIAEEGAERARASARPTLHRVKETVGLL